MPAPQFSDELRKACRDRLLSCLADLTGQATVVEKGVWLRVSWSGIVSDICLALLEGKSAVKIPGAASDGRFWVDRVLSTIELLEKDTKHVAILAEVDEDDRVLRSKARQLAARLQTVSPLRPSSRSVR